MMIVLMLIACLLASPVQAASLLWDTQPTTGALTIERSATVAGPFATVATVPEGTTTFVLTPGAFGFYRVRNPSVISNVVQFSLDLYTGGLEDRVTALEAQLATLAMAPPPVVTGNLLTAKQIDSSHVELTCAGTSMKTTGSGLKRIVECLP